MSKRMVRKTEWYAHLLQRLHIISEQERQQMLNELHKNREDRDFS